MYSLYRVLPETCLPHTYCRSNQQFSSHSYSHSQKDNAMQISNAMDMSNAFFTIVFHNILIPKLPLSIPDLWDIFTISIMIKSNLSSLYICTLLSL